MSSDPVVLVVEDERDLADLYAMWLAGPYTVRTAYTGTDALETIDEDVDAVLLDRNMPDCTGDDVLRELRTEYTTPVAFVTGVDPSVDIVSLPVDAYRHKPVSKDVLEATVEELVSRSTLCTTERQILALQDKLEALESTVAVDTTAPETIERLREAVCNPDQLERVLETSSVSADY